MVVTEVAILMEGEWSCYRSGHFSGGRMVMLWRWTVQRRENHPYLDSRFNGEVTEVVSLI